MLTLASLLDEYVLTMRSERYSPRSVDTARSVLRSAIDYWSNGTEARLDDFTLVEARRYLLYLQEERERYAGHGFAPVGGRLSPNTVHLHARNVRAFSSWLEAEGYTEQNVMTRLRLPRVPQHLVVPLTDDECHRLIGAFNPKTSLGARGLAIVMVLLDTGVRASELCGLGLENIDLETGECHVFGKGGKERVVALGYQALRTVRRYVANSRPDSSPSNSSVFPSASGRPMTKNSLGQLFRRL